MPVKFSFERLTVWTAIALGVFLRFVALNFPDVSTDEAQFVLGTSAAQPPVGMALFRLAQFFFGYDIAVTRGVSVAFGIATLGLIYVLARFYTDHKTSLLITAIASIFPSHIIFSRLAYLSVMLCFAWVLILVSYLSAIRKKDNAWFLVLLFLACIFATFIKTQGVVLPLLLLIGRMITLRSRVWKDDISWVLVLSLVPMTLYFLTHPGIAATLFLYGGSLYGVSGIVDRAATLLVTWWKIEGVFVIVIAFSFAFLRSFDWRFIALLTVGILIGLILGPSHEYYTTYLILFSLPIGIGLMRLPSWSRVTTLFVLSSLTFLYVLPGFPASRAPFDTPGYWNTHIDDIAPILSDVREVIVLGNAGHHIRWYLEPRVLLGNEMDITEKEGVFLLLDPTLVLDFENGKILYADNKLVIVRR